MIQYFKNLFAALDNRINPIAIKEMRQAVRSRYITLLLQLYLLTELLVSGIFLLTFDTKNLTSGGTELFTPLVILLFIVNLVCVPVYTSTRLTREVRGNDAMFSSTLTPMQIVRGKFYCGLIISLLLFSAAAPFIILTYLLRGLDIQEILLTLYWTFLTIQVFNCYGIVFGALNINIVIRIILATIMGFAIMGILDSFSFGTFSSVSSADWEVFIIATLIFLFLGESFMMLAACMLSPVSFNRMTRPRIFATVSSLLLFLIALVHKFITSSNNYLEAAFAFIFVMSIVFLGIGLCERTTLSARQIQQIPRNPLWRALAFPFFTGVGSAIAWFFMMFGFLLFSDAAYLNGELLRSLVTMERPFPFLYVSLFYVLCGMLVRAGIDYWRHNNLNYRLPENPRIVIYPAPQNGSMTILYSLILIAIPSIIPALFIFNTSSGIQDFLFSFSPFNYLDYYPSSDKHLIPRLFGFFSISILFIFSIFSFLYYYSRVSMNSESSNLNSTDKQ